MNLETLFVREKREFYQLYRTVNDVFFLENRLPKQVFREPFRYFGLKNSTGQWMGIFGP